MGQKKGVRRRQAANGQAGARAGSSDKDLAAAAGAVRQDTDTGARQGEARRQVPGLTALLAAVSEELGTEREVGAAAVCHAMRVVFRRRYPGHEVEVELSADGRPRVTVREPGAEWRDVSAEVVQLKRHDAAVFQQAFKQRLVEGRRRLLLDAAAAAVGEAYRCEMVQYVNGGWEVDLPLPQGRVSAFLPAAETIPGELLRTGDRAWVYVQGAPGPGRLYAVVSRKHPQVVRRLLERNVPEIAEGVVEIVGVAREPGVLCKVAVRSRLPEVNPVGAVVGVRSERIRNVEAELGEPVEVHHWLAGVELGQRVQECLQPARVVAVTVDGQGERATAWVPADALSVAIGPRGVRARLAAKLCGVKALSIKASDTREVELG